MATSDRRRPSRLRPALAAALTLLILVPAGLLFLRTWQQTTDRQDATGRERRGVEYLGGLSPLVSALAEAQSTALQGVQAPPAGLSIAIDRMNALDARLGADLGTGERWKGLRDRIGKLPAATGPPAQVFQAHAEVTTLVLALFRSVADRSALSRDPDNDVAHMQRALTVDLPGATVMVSRMGDLSAMLAGLQGSDDEKEKARAVLVPQFGAAVQSVNSHVTTLTDNLQAAVDDTASTTLSGNLVTTVDAFRRGVEAFLRSANPTQGAAPNVAGMATAQTQLQTSLSGLAGVLTREMTDLLDARADTLDSRGTEAAIMFVLVVVLAAAAVAVTLAGPPRVRAFSAPPLDQMPMYGTERRERSGALR